MNASVDSIRLSGEAVAAAVAQAYGRTVSAEQVIDGESFFSVCLRDETGGRYVAKVGQGPFSADEVDWQEQLLDRLNAVGVPYQTPTIVRDLHARTVSDLEFGVEGASREAMLLTWVSGELMAHVASPSMELLADVGRLSGMLSNAIGDLDAPYAHRKHHWVLTSSMDALQDTLGIDPDRVTPGQIHEVIAFFQKDSVDLSALPQATVHQDLNPHNITVDPMRPDRVAGVIDFNDAVRTARVADISIASAYAMFGQDDPIRACAATINGFQSVTELTTEERKAILPLAMIRLVVNWATWSELSAGDPASYAANRMRSTFPMISRMVDLGLEDARDQLLREIS